MDALDHTPAPVLDAAAARLADALDSRRPPRLIAALLRWLGLGGRS
ncbi:hypothetical protein [Streptomyces sp. 184]